MLDLPNHPRYGAPLNGSTKTVDGVVFRCYRAGIMRFVMCSDDFRITVQRRTDADTFTAAIDGVYIQGAGDSGRAKRFRSEWNAMEAGVKLWRAKGAIPHSRL